MKQIRESGWRFCRSSICVKSWRELKHYEDPYAPVEPGTMGFDDAGEFT